MKVRSLRNNQQPIITNCDLEPIHIPGSIQPHGYLLGVLPTDLSIRYCSENCSTLLNQPVASILGQPLSAFFSTSDIDRLVKGSSPLTKDTIPFVFATDNRSYHVTAFRTADVWVLEFEPFENVLPGTTAELFIQLRRFAYYTERTDNLKALCQDVAEETRHLTGYDRVMVYRFDNDYNGEVFAESRDENLDSFLGLHYPASDIPKQARALFQLNSIRMIADVQAEDIPIFTLNNEGAAANLDLSLSVLRSVSPMHIQYLKNMGVGATFTIALLHHGRLWGLIACHHRTPKHIPYHKRLAVQLQAIFLSSQIDVRQVADEFDLMSKTEKKLDALRSRLLSVDNALNHPETLGGLAELLNADGVFIRYRNSLYTYGLLPDQATLLQLSEWLGGLPHHSLFYTAKIADDYPDEASLGTIVRGLVHVGFAKQTPDGIVWTRQELEKTVNWGGNPDKPMETEGESLTPRKSFSLWKQAVKGQSGEWRKPELHAATVICSAVQHRLHLADMRQEEQRYKSLNERLQKANEELANMNWIGTHDLKEPLRKIQMYASVILERQGEQIPETVKNTVARMKTSAQKMQSLIEDLLAYSKVANEEKTFVNIHLDTLLEEVQADFSETIAEKGGRVQWSQLPVIKGIPFQVRQLFINLVGNALKFTRDGVSPLITISAETVSMQTRNNAPMYKISVADNGIGFHPDYRGEIFKLFRRFHEGQFTGSGIGLSICRKIAEVHNGFIEAEGEEGKGACFNIYFPVHQPTDDSGDLFAKERTDSTI